MYSRSEPERKEEREKEKERRRERERERKKERKKRRSVQTVDILEKPQGQCTELLLDDGTRMRDRRNSTQSCGSGILAVGGLDDLIRRVATFGMVLMKARLALSVLLFYCRRRSYPRLSLASST
ncbi:putative phosphoenolpyruvate carboxylase [Rosa chinensis]|uniref:Putative phosphoenolpyruvate carboxylase n=1 Tax=Rosa chinensis TaxID=74649 RepID=A0A2P6SC11_ROSCH|nr:putative phosphoenolpyruvate carboxylase [Rosa chinensis]